MDLYNIQQLYGKEHANLLNNTGKYIEHKDLFQCSKGILVQASGIFDMLHIGHVTFLEQAALFGDKLIVSINSDASAKKYKGDSRPYFNAVQRAYLLCALQCVDYVTIFEEDDPSEIISLIKPDIYVKGFDTIIDSNTPELRTLFKTSALRLTSEETDLCHTTDIVEKIKNG